MAPPETIVVVGTDTGVGKTVFAAALARALDGFYWKPVQAGREDDTDTERAHRLSGLPRDRFLPEAYVLRSALSPHRAAEIDGVRIDSERLVLPSVTRPLVVEAAGGLMVPLTRHLLQIDVFARWGTPVVLCARTTLGTINHTLLSLEALRRRGIPVQGVAFIGEPQEASEAAIATLGRVRRLGRLPLLQPLEPGALQRAFGASFQIGDLIAREVGA